MQICVYNGCITWPRYFQSVRKMNICGQHVETRSLWWDFVEYPDYASRWGSTYSAGFYGPLYNQRHLTRLGYYPVYRDIPADTNYKVRAIPQLADIGKTITLFGEDNYGQPLRHKADDNTWQPGRIITLAKPYGSTGDTYVSKIDRVLKDETQANVPVFCVDDSGNIYDIAHYEPTEKNPSYARDRLHAGNAGCCNGNQSQFTVDAVVKAFGNIHQQESPAARGRTDWLGLLDSDRYGVQVRPVRITAPLPA